jgi:hypothetical protein
MPTIMKILKQRVFESRWIKIVLCVCFYCCPCDTIGTSFSKGERREEEKKQIDVEKLTEGSFLLCSSDAAEHSLNMCVLCI